MDNIKRRDEYDFKERDTMMMRTNGNGKGGDQEVPTSTKNTKSSSEDGGSNDNEGQGFWNEGGQGFGGGTITKKRCERVIHIKRDSCLISKIDFFPPRGNSLL